MSIVVRIAAAAGMGVAVYLIGRYIADIGDHLALASGLTVAAIVGWVGVDA